MLERNLRILSYSGLIRGNDRSKTDQRGIMHGNLANIPTASHPMAIYSPNARFDSFLDSPPRFATLLPLLPLPDRLTFDPCSQD